MSILAHFLIRQRNHAREMHPMEAEGLYEKLLKPIETQMIMTVGRIVRDPEDAADVFQEVLVTIWIKLDRIARHPNPHAYILRICVTRSYDALRKKARRLRRETRLDSFKAMLLPFCSQDTQKECDRASAVRNAISMLPPHQGQAVLLRAMDDSPYHVIANILGCSEATARSHFSKGKARLTKIIAELGIS